MKHGVFYILIVLSACSKNESESNSRLITFGQPQLVTINGYSADIMEPFLASNGETLFFNNSNHPSVNTNLHFAKRINDITFEYQGELKGVNTESLDGVATMDNSNAFYFVSTRSYNQTLATIYTGQFENDSISNITLVTGISKNQAGWVNFDVEVSKDGNFLYFVDGRFDENGGPYEADIAIAEKTDIGFQRINSDLLKNINTSALEYAACLSSDMLELYFTRVDAPISETSMPKIYVSTRESVNEPFRKPYRIDMIEGFVEAATISPDNQIIYYHKLEGQKYVLYMTQKISE
ncbi:MAG TPA: hypothetical protein PK784_00320 [Tenuifilaceae bacterium]|nr:hypothetical protein [Tenuifilaceae bacterium]HPN22165.1 hypothetical protein [Tenuifilaceae bacterium]HPV55820.1 hypothetical protein [Tenuifilaceae bacterium]